jgi:tRNA modification GTPase
LELALEVIRSSDGQVELAADEVHRAIRALDILIGRVGVEDVLGEVFSSFCIGK